MLNLALSALVLAGAARATISNMRGTIPGSLHQCQNTSFFFFDTDDTGSKTVLLVSPSDATTLGTGVVDLDDVLSSITPLQAVNDITSADAAEYNFILKIAADTEFATFGFLSDGQGKNLDLARTVATPLPGATSCLSGGSTASSASSAKATSSAASFVTVVKPSSTSSSSSSSISSSSVSASTSVVATPTTTSVPSSASITVLTTATASASTNATAAKPSASTIVVDTTYLLTSFITLTPEDSTDGTVSSRVVSGGHITGSINATIAPFGTALFSLPSNSSSSTATASAGNATVDGDAQLVSTTYTFSTPDGETVFAVAQMALSQNYSVDALLMTFQTATNGSSAFGNATVLGKASSINSTMFRIDAYTVDA